MEAWGGTRGDWRHPSPRTRLGTVVVLAALLGAALSPPLAERLGYELPYGGERQETARFQIVPGDASVTLATASAMRPADRWRAWVATDRQCPGASGTNAPIAAQRRTMLCLVNFARSHQGLRALRPSAALTRASTSKAADIVRCRDFSHAACGRPVNQAAIVAGYRGPWAENLYVGEGVFAIPRVALDRWLNSTRHRANLFNRRWRVTGVAVATGAHVNEIRDGSVWVNQFGT